MNCTVMYMKTENASMYVTKLQIIHIPSAFILPWTDLVQYTVYCANISLFDALWLWAELPMNTCCMFTGKLMSIYDVLSPNRFVTNAGGVVECHWASAQILKTFTP